MPSSFLLPEFLSAYEGKRPRNAGVLFDVVYLRTFARWVPAKNRRERWDETIARVVNYNVGLYSGPKPAEALVKEAEELFDKIFNLEVYPAGRSLWIAGTEAAIQWPEANFNCTMLVIDRLEAFCEVFHLLMVGAGVGYRILEDDVSELPKFNKDVELYHIPYNHGRRFEKTEYSRDNDFWEIEVGDSKEGWVEALRIFMKALTYSGKTRITIDYNFIRPAGERIKRFGGRAAGPHGLKEMFDLIVHTIKESPTGKLSATAVMDICNVIAKNVLVGGVRRSSQIALGSHNDAEFADAKMNLYTDPTKVHKRHRTMSNNSLVFDSKPSKEKIDEILENIKLSWEPGFLNREAASKRRPWFAAINPCGEALGADRGNCNLSGINLVAHVSEGKFDLVKACESIKAATRIGIRQTNITWSLPEWDKVHKRDRLLGVSLTGIMDMLDSLEIEFDSEEAIHIWSSLNKAANEEADSYANEMRIPRPLLVTILKPEGTISQLPTVSSGLHRAWSPYYIRRIRVSSMDPVAKALQHLGVPNEPDVNKGERIVFSFPIKTAAKISANDEPAKRQYERYLTMMKYYVDHNASCTLTVGEDEWEGIKEMIYENWDNTVAVAFAAKDYSQYPQLPYEAVSSDMYDSLMSTFPSLDNLTELVNQFEETEAEEDELDVECKSGFCPVR